MSKPLSVLDAYQAIDEITMQYSAGSINASTAMLHIMDILTEQEQEDA